MNNLSSEIVDLKLSLHRVTLAKLLLVKEAVQIQREISSNTT